MVPSKPWKPGTWRIVMLTAVVSFFLGVLAHGMLIPTTTSADKRLARSSAVIVVKATTQEFISAAPTLQAIIECSTLSAPITLRPYESAQFEIHPGLDLSIVGRAVVVIHSTKPFRVNGLEGTNVRADFFMELPINQSTTLDFEGEGTITVLIETGPYLAAFLLSA